MPAQSAADNPHHAQKARCKHRALFHPMRRNRGVPLRQQALDFLFDHILRNIAHNLVGHLATLEQ